MRWKPSETEIIDYLYGTMNPDENTRFEEYVKNNPEVAREVEELKRTRQLLPTLSDVEIIPPLVFRGDKSGTRIGSPGKWFLPISIAASITIILITGYLTEFRMSINKDGIELGFKNETPHQVAGFSKDEVEQLVEQRMAVLKTELTSEIVSLESGFDAQLASNRAITSSQIENALKVNGKTQNDEQMLKFISQIRGENEKMMANFYKVSAEEQRQYIRNILLEYNRFIEEQRKGDLEFMQANFIDLKTASELRQEETDKLLASIISTVNSQYSLGQ